MYRTEKNKLEDYIINHIEPEDELLVELKRRTNLDAKNPQMIAGHVHGKILKMFSNMIKPTNILEIGTFTGYSALCLASGMKSGGVLHTIEIDTKVTPIAEEFFKKAGMDDIIILHIGEVKDIVTKLNIMFDLIYIDGDKQNYSKDYDSVIDYLNVGGFIIADDAIWYDKVIGNTYKYDVHTRGIVEFNDKIIKDSRVENVIIQVEEGLNIIRKVKR